MNVELARDWGRKELRNDVPLADALRTFKATYPAPWLVKAFEDGYIEERNKLYHQSGDPLDKLFIPYKPKTTPFNSK